MGWSGTARGWRNLVMGPDPWWQPSQPLTRWIGQVPDQARIVDLGAGGRRIRPNIVAVDFGGYPGTNVAANLHQLPFPDGSFDVVICTGTWEHVATPVRAGAEAVRILRESGTIYIEVPFLWPYHADPLDNTRWTLPGLCLLLEQMGIEKSEAGILFGPGTALALMCVECLKLMGWNDSSRKALYIVGRWIFFPLKFMDAWLNRKEHAHGLAAGVYFRGVKRVGEQH